MKIAVPTRNNMVDEHFGHCDHYTIFSVSNENKIEKIEKYQAPEGCGCKSNVASLLADMGVKTLLAGNMGEGAVQKIMYSGINVYRGCSGDVNQVVEAFLKQQITDSGQICNHHGHNHEAGHNCGH